MRPSDMPSLRHVTHIIPTLRHGGAERLVVSLANGLVERGIHVSIVTLCDDIPLAAMLDPRVNVRIVRKRGKISFGLVRALKQTLADLSPDVVHTHLFGADVWGRRAAHALGIPIITTEHNINRAEGYMKHCVKRWLKDTSTLYVAVSRTVMAYMRAVYRVTRDIVIIPPGIEMSRYARIGKPTITSPYKILMIGRLVKQKGFDRGLDALASLRDIEWRCTIVGSGEEERALNIRCKKLGIEDRVVFVPTQDDVLPWYDTTDIVLMPSRWEGFGMVGVEAMAAGRVLVATKVGGLADSVSHGQTGRLAQPSVADMSEQLRWVFDHPREAREMAERARIAAEAYDSARMVDAYLSCYESVI